MENTLIVLKKASVGCYGSEENEPQINADERRFVTSNPAHLIGSWDLAFFLFLSFGAAGTELLGWVIRIKIINAEIRIILLFTILPNCRSTSSLQST